MSHVQPGNPEPTGNGRKRQQFGAAYLLRLWLWVSEPVGRKAYVLSGISLIVLKYACEALAIWAFTGRFFAPTDFLNPLLSARLEILRTAPDWLPWAIFLWTLPFMWIALSMSVRRMADAGVSPWLGLLVLIPIVNLVFMIIASASPGRRDNWSPRRAIPNRHRQAASAAMACFVSLLVGGLMFAVSVYLFSDYGASLFIGTPVLMGAVAAYIFNQPQPRTYSASVGIAAMALTVAMLMLIATALEGMICLAMAAPIVVPLGCLGGILGKAIADSTRRNPRGMFTAILLLPIVAGAESFLSRGREYEVVTAIEIDAPPDAVWKNVVSFPDLAEPTEWFFRWGIACPQRARIVGTGVGAMRYCQFTTGTFVEPVTIWEPGRRLRFDVTQQPAPMFELSPYRHVHPPHLDGYLRSNSGEFLLLELPGGRTRLEGRTWYDFDMFPQSYWTLWSDYLIHRIHERVLIHIQDLSEQTAQGGAVAADGRSIGRDG